MMARALFRVLWLPTIVGSTVGAAGWLMGVVAADAVLLAVLVALVLAVPRWVGLPKTFGWPDPPERTTAGGWYEVGRLASVLRRPDDRREAFSRRVAPHLRTIAEGKLARLGVTWHDPAAARILGPDVHALLDDPGNARPGGHRSPIDMAERVLGRLDEIPDSPRP